MRSLALVMVLLVSITVAHAGSDPLQPPTNLPPPAFVEAEKGDVIVMTVGSLNALKIRVGKTSNDVVVSRDDILDVRFDPNGNVLLLRGKAVGSATLTLIYSDKTRDTYTVVVDYVRKPITKLLRPGHIAFTVGLAYENAVAGQLSLNDYVVVYCTKASGTEKKTTALMMNIRVLSNPLGGNDGRCTVLLEVTNDEAKSLRNATENGTLALGLMAEADVKDEKILRDRKGDDESPKEAAPGALKTR